MSIKFNAEYNKYIQKVVRNYNKRQKRMEEAGFKYIPDKVKIKELKKHYNSRTELNKELNRLKKLKMINVQNKRVTNSGLNVFKWQYNYLKTNIDEAKNYFNEEYERVSKRGAKFPGERLYLDAIKSKINLLEQDINYLTQSQFRSVMSAVNEFYNAPRNREAQYRGFLSEVEWVMEKTGIPEEKRDKFFKKFSKLTPSQFLYAYDNNSIIDRVYNLYVRQGENEPFLSDPKDAKKVIEELMKEADDIVKDAQLNVD